MKGATGHWHEGPTSLGREAVFDLLVSKADDGFLVVGRDQRIEACYGGAEQILGRSFTSLKGQPVQDLPSLGPSLAMLMERAQRRGTAVRYFDFELEAGPAEPRRFVDLQVVPAEQNAGLVIVFHPRGQALTGARPGPERLIMANLSAALAHEIRNPLSGVRAAAQLAGKSLPANKRHLSELIMGECERLAGLVDQLESLTDREAPAREPVNLHEVVDHVCSLLDGDLSEATRLRLKFDPSLPSVRGNRDGLVQILLNLVRNACEAAGTQPVTITIHTRYNQGFHLGGREGNGAHLPFELEIEDDGPGVPADMEEDLFQPFVTSKEAGRGLGLAIVAFLVREMGAHLRYERAQPHGARFLLNFARATEEELA